MAVQPHVAVAGGTGSSIVVAGLHINRLNAVIAGLADDVHGGVFEASIRQIMARAIQCGFTAVFRLQQLESAVQIGILLSAVVPENEELAARRQLVMAFDDLAGVFAEIGAEWATSESLDDLFMVDNDWPLGRFAKEISEEHIGQHSVSLLQSLSIRPSDWLFAAMSGWSQIDIASFPCNSSDNRDWLQRITASCRVLQRQDCADEETLKRAAKSAEIALAESQLFGTGLSIRAKTIDDIRHELRAFHSPRGMTARPREKWRLLPEEVPREAQAFISLDYSEESLERTSIEPSLRRISQLARNLVRLVLSRKRFQKNVDAATKHDLFLSHSSADKGIVRSLAVALEEIGVSVWLDEEKLLAGRAWQNDLERAISESRAAAVLIGPHGLGNWETPEVWACTSEFIDRAMPVIPVLLPGVGDNPEVPLFLRQFTWVDMRQGITADGLHEIRRATFGDGPVP